MLYFVIFYDQQTPIILQGTATEADDDFNDDLDLTGINSDEEPDVESLDEMDDQFG